MSTNIYKNLPETVLEGNRNDQEFLERLVIKDVNRSRDESLEKALQFNFILDKQLAGRNKKQRPLRRKKTFLTRKERKELGLVKLPKQNWNYEELEELREMWAQYMRENLKTAKAPKTSDSSYNQFASILTKSELIGAQVAVVRSKVPSQVGLSGTVVLETKMTLQIVTCDNKLKVVSKMTSVFEIVLDRLKFTIFGRHLVMKPGERSVKKIKSQIHPDL